jgi:hypothetical protein
VLVAAGAVLDVQDQVGERNVYMIPCVFFIVLLLNLLYLIGWVDSALAGI